MREAIEAAAAAVQCLSDGVSCAAQNTANTAYPATDPAKLPRGFACLDFSGDDSGRYRLWGDCAEAAAVAASHGVLPHEEDAAVLLDARDPLDHHGVPLERVAGEHDLTRPGLPAAERVEVDVDLVAVPQHGVHAVAGDAVAPPATCIGHPEDQDAV